MAKVETVLGPVDAEELGKTLIHEHFFFGYPGFQGDMTLGTYDFTEKVKQGTAAAEIMQKHGVQTVIDPTPNECGRDVKLLKAVAEETGLNIICATGYYYEGEGATPYFKFRQSLGYAEQEIYELFKEEIKNGIEGTGIKPGIIKLASSKGEITDYEKMFFKAASKVQKETGIVLLTHTQEGTMGFEQAEFLIEQGADPTRIVIGHMCGTTNIQDHLKTLEQGVFIALDRFGLQGAVGTPQDEERMAVLLGLLGAGYENKLFLSHDTVNVWWGRPPVLSEELQQQLQHWRPDHLFENIAPALKERGVSEKKLDTMFEKNAAALFN
ncbi:phosphotriesterase family protein [Alteribacillus bidgolensis]|uniref:Phosphotriesterase-related protein n=1 Tax=Alteribacillus bidgolensis TaxID=930129 RepID=A0A1G8G4M3_9BACI|nr:phosphotriesterase [Alteribacillus bidgolensis]SDH89354.1 phosphotriesterase-related protein [Alteribacillus bidgolensis]